MCREAHKSNGDSFKVSFAAGFTSDIRGKLISTSDVVISR